MLDVARNRSSAETVTWIESDAASLLLPDRFDLIVMTGHVFQVFLTDEDIAACLSNLRGHLAPGGRLAFATRNPAIEIWRGWTADDSRERLTVEAIGDIDVCWDVTDVSPPYVTFDTRYTFPGGEESVTPSTLRFMDRAELAGHLESADFKTFEWYGDWDRSPLTADSPEIIVVAS
jgi:SAM-dependent methyltransferase